MKINQQVNPLLQIVTDPFANKVFMQQWEMLYHSSKQHTIYQSPAWNNLWWKNFAKSDMQLRFYALYSVSGELLGLAPLYLKRFGSFSSQQSSLHFIGASNFASDYCMFLFDDNRLDSSTAHAKILQLIFSDDSWSALQLFNLPLPDAQKAALVDELDKISHGRCLVRHLYAAPTFVASDEKSFRNLKNKKSMKRALNKVARLGTISFKRILEKHEARELLPTFFDQHRSRRALANDTSQFDDLEQQRFYQDIIESFDLSQVLHFSVLSSGNKPIAFHLGFISQNRFIWYKPSFDAELAAYSPGKVLIGNLLEEAARLNLAEFDFTIGNESFKFQFANDRREVYEVLVLRNDCLYLLTLLQRKLRRAYQHLRSLSLAGY